MTTGLLCRSEVHAQLRHLPGGHDQKTHGNWAKAKKALNAAEKLGASVAVAAKAKPAPKGRTPSGKMSRPRKQPKRLSQVDIAEAVRSGIADEERISQGDHGETSLVRTNDGSLLIRKQVATENNYHTAKRQLDAEDLASRLGRAVGATVPNVYVDGDNTTVYMEFMAGTMAFRAGKDRQAKAVATDAGKRLGLVDLMTQAWDRNTANWLIDRDGNPVGIDHAFAFDDHHRLQYDSDGHAKPFSSFSETFMEQWWNAHDGVRSHSWKANYSAAEMAEIRHEVQLLQPHFEAKGQHKWFADVMAIINGISKASGVAV